MTQQHIGEEDLTLYHYNEMTAGERQQVEEHLQHCTACQRQRQKLQQDLQQLPHPVLNLSPVEQARFTAGVMKGRAQGRWHKPALSVALLACCVLFVTLALQPFNIPHQQVPDTARLALETTAAPETMGRPPVARTERLLATSDARSTIAPEVEMVDQVEMVHKLEILANFELLQHMEMLEDMSS